MLYLALSQIPPGRVITYGELARRAGMPNGARQVGRMLAQLPAGFTTLAPRSECAG